MNVELKFKPGVRTSLNSNNNIRDNFSSDKTKAGGTQTRNATASSATTNLASMSRASGNWNSSTGSILNNNAPVRSMNNRVKSGTTTTTASSSVTSPKQGTVRSSNYVGASLTPAYTQPKYTQFQNWGFTRTSNMTGYNDRAMQRLQDAAYGQGAYVTSYAQATQASQSLDLAATATTVIDLVKTGKEIVDIFKGSKGSDGGTVSETATAAIKNMKSANDSATLGSAISNAKQDLTNTKASLAEMKTQLDTAKAEQPTCEANLKNAQTTFTNLETQVKAQKEIANKESTTLPGLKTAWDSAQAQVDAMPENTPEEKAAKETAQKQVDEKQKKAYEDLKAQIDAAKEQLKTLEPQLAQAKTDVQTAQEALNANKKIQEETPAKIKDTEATIASYEKEIPNQEKRLEKLTKEEDKKFKELTDDKTKLEGECTTLNNAGKTDKAKKKEEKLAKVNEERNALQEKITIRNLDDVQYAGGHEFKKGLDANGQPIFVIDGQKVTEEEYNKQLGVKPEGEE